MLQEAQTEQELIEVMQLKEEFMKQYNYEEKNPNIMPFNPIDYFMKDFEIIEEEKEATNNE
jgi:hypothetical protein